MIQIQHRRGPASQWTSVNPILAEGELGVETDTLKVKLGDGIHDWTHLPYFTQGAVGPANSLSIGTVTSGVTPSATITGTAPVQTLNLVLEQGDAATITAGTTTNKLPGTTAEVTNSGDSKNAVFDFKIPRGTTVAVGTTTTGSTSSTAAVTNSGTASDLVLDFAIPRGAGVPTGGASGQILTKVSGTDFDTVWQENYADWTSQVKHTVKAGEALSKGMPVYVTGANGTNMIVGKAGNSSEATSSKTMGLLQQDLANNGTGFVIAEGLLSGLNTSSATAGDPVWLGTTGTLIYGLASKPVAPAHLVFIGIVTRSHATNGEIFIKVQNGFELGELHDVLITSPTNGQSLTYDSSTGLWKNSTPASNLDSLTDVTLTSPADKQVLQYEAATSQWKNKQATGGVTVSNTTPASPIDGDGLFYSEDGTLFIRYNDGTSTQWVQPNAVLSSQIEQRYYSPNYILNGAFDIWQRGTSFSGNVYAADRWYGGNNPSAIARSTDVPSGFTYSIDVTGANHLLGHRIESVNANSLAGKTVTISFYAKSLSGTNGMTVAIGTPSAADNFAISNIEQTSGTLAVSSSWTRFTATFSALSASVAKGAFIYIYRNGSTATDRTLITGVQIEEGSTATAFRRNANSIQGELAACQRYYYRNYAGSGSGIFCQASANSSTSGLAAVYFPVPMRTVPSTTLEWSGNGGAYSMGNMNGGTTASVTSLGTIGGDYVSQTSILLTISGSGFSTTGQYILRGNSTAGAYLGFSAEL